MEERTGGKRVQVARMLRINVSVAKISLLFSDWSQVQLLMRLPSRRLYFMIVKPVEVYFPTTWPITTDYDSR